MSKELSRRDLIHKGLCIAAAGAGFGGVAKGAYDQEHGRAPDTISPQITCTGKSSTENCTQGFTIVENNGYTEIQRRKIAIDAIAWVASFPLASFAYFIKPDPIPKNEIPGITKPFTFSKKAARIPEISQEGAIFINSPKPTIEA
jgi:hypothetical protein